MIIAISTDDSGPLELGWQASCACFTTELDREVAGIGPVCELSGRCCRFEEYGHTLFVSTAEVEFLSDTAPAPERPLDQGRPARGRTHAGTARPAKRGRWVPYLLLRPVLSGGSPPSFGAFHRSHEEVVLRP